MSSTWLEKFDCRRWRATDEPSVTGEARSDDETTLRIEIHVEILVPRSPHKSVHPFKWILEIEKKKNDRKKLFTKSIR